MLDLKQYQEEIDKLRTSGDNLIERLLDTILNFNRYIMPKKREDGEYHFIPINGRLFLFIMRFVHIYTHKHLKDFIFVDLGAGDGQTKVVTQLNSTLRYKGIEKYPLPNYAKNIIIKGDFLKIDTFKKLPEGLKIYYAYNPLCDRKMMYDALGFWITEVLKKGDILIYIKTSNFDTDYEKIFESQFKALGNIYIYEKE